MKYCTTKELCKVGFGCQKTVRDFVKENSIPTRFEDRVLLIDVDAYAKTLADSYMQMAEQVFKKADTAKEHEKILPKNRPPKMIQDYQKNMYDKVGFQSEFIPTDYKETVEYLLSCLTDREAEVMRLRCGCREGRIYTLEETGKIFDITRERVRQIENKAIRKLRKRGYIMAIGINEYKEKERQEMERQEKERQEKERQEKERSKIEENKERFPTLASAFPSISVRAYNCLMRSGIDSPYKLMGVKKEDLLKMRNCGIKTATEIMDAVNALFYV